MVLIAARLLRVQIARTGVLVPRLDEEPIMVGQQPQRHGRPAVQPPGGLEGVGHQLADERLGVAYQSGQAPLGQDGAGSSTWSIRRAPSTWRNPKRSRDIDWCTSIFVRRPSLLTSPGG